MNTLFAIVVGGVVLVLIARSLLRLTKDAAGLDARNRGQALFTFAAIMIAFAVMLVVIYARHVG